MAPLRPAAPIPSLRPFSLRGATRPAACTSRRSTRSARRRSPRSPATRYRPSGPAGSRSIAGARYIRLRCPSTGNAISTATFDTHAAVRDLEATGLDTRQAEAIATAIRNAHGNLATKADLASVRADLAIIRWVVGIQSAISLATFAAVLFLAAKLL